MAVVALCACEKPSTDNAIRVEGTDVGDCADGADNDADGAFDCSDASCVGSLDCPSDTDTLGDTDEFGDTDAHGDSDSDTDVDTSDTGTGTICPPNQWVPPVSTWPVSTPPTTICAEGTDIGQVAPDARGLDQFGTETSLWQFYGSPVLVLIGTMWCGPCQDLGKASEHVRSDYEADDLKVLQVLFENVEGREPAAEDLTLWASLPALSEDTGFSATTFSDPVLSDFEGQSGLSVAVINQTYPVALLVDGSLHVVGRVESPTEQDVRVMLDGYFTP